jgi:hypothetical protein
VVSNPVLAREILGDNVSKAEYAPRMVEIMKLRRKADAEKIAKAKRDKPITQAQQKKMIREFVKNQSSAAYNNPWTKTQVWSLSDDQLIHQYNLIKTRLHKDGLLSSHQPHPSMQPADTELSSQGLQIGDAIDTEPSHSADNTSSADKGAHIADPAHDVSADPSMVFLLIIFLLLVLPLWTRVKLRLLNKIFLLGKGPEDRWRKID